MKKAGLFIILSMSFLGFYSCYTLSFFGLNPIIASALTGFLGSFLPKVQGESPEAVIYASSFAAIGMDEVGIPHSLMWVIPILVFILYELSKVKLIGYGGKLGTIAFVAVGKLLGVKWFL